MVAGACRLEDVCERASVVRMLVGREHVGDTYTQLFGQVQQVFCIVGGIHQQRLAAPAQQPTVVVHRTYGRDCVHMGVRT